MKEEEVNIWDYQNSSQQKKTDMFRYIVDKVKGKTQGWSKKFLSQGGKEVLLKAVALAMPIYSMNIFKLPKEICEEINMALNRFWWNTDENRRGVHWFSWNRLCLPKREGSLGFRELESFNIALLGKQVWRILQRPECLMARVLKARYFPDTNILNARQGQKASFVWRSLLHGKDLLKQGMRYVIGNGSMVNAFVDPWLPLHSPRPPLKKDDDVANCWVKDWFNSSSTRWDIDKVREAVSPEDVDKMLAIKISPEATSDFLIWHYTKEGIYTVKSAYWLASHLPSRMVNQAPPGDVQVKQALWKLDTPPKLKHFLLRLMSGALATGANLKYRHMRQQAICCRCCKAEETTSHLFFDCEYARALWRASGVPDPTIISTTTSLEDKIKAICHFNTSSRTRHLKHLPIWIMWRLWKSRNVLYFQRKHIPWITSLKLAREDAKEWMEMNISNISGDIQLQQPGTNRTEHQAWQPPAIGWLKCNNDGSLVSSDLPAKCGWIISDHNRVYMGSGQATGGLQNDSLECELQSLIIAMQHCLSRGYKRVCFEGDNQKVVNLVNGIKINFGAYNWIREVRRWKTKFEAVEFRWINRICNKPADILAKKEIPNNSLFFFHSLIPHVISDALQCDYYSYH